MAKIPPVPKIKSNDGRNGTPMFTDFYWELLCKQQEEEKKLKGDK